MPTIEVSPTSSRPDAPIERVTNDFTIQVATVNGSGSQTANTVLMRVLFQMGIPVSGKNLFPSMPESCLEAEFVAVEGNGLVDIADDKKR